MKTVNIIIVAVLSVFAIWTIYSFAALGKGNQASNSSQNQTSGQESIQDHHGGTQVVDESKFKSLMGKTAPDFTLEGYDGKKFQLSSLKGKKVVLFFNEGIMCYPACWNQIAAFARDQSFKSEDVIVLNIMVDNKANWKQAVDKMPELAPATALFDTNAAVSAIYGVLTLPSSMHKGQFPGHSYVLVDKEGIVRFLQDDVQMGVRNADILKELAKI